MEKEQYEIMRKLEDSLWWYVGMRAIVDSLLAPLSDNPKQWRMLDAGCGTGATLDFLSPRGPVVGVDIASEALDHCRQRGHHRVTYGSIEALPFASHYFDLVTSFDVIYHQAVKDDVAALREFGRVLRPGGLLLVRVPAYDWLRGAHDVAVHTRHRYSRQELRDKMAAAGFDVIRVTSANFFLLPVAIVKRMLEGRGAKLDADLSMPGQAVNRLLTGLLSLEARMLRIGNLPWGLSSIGLGIKRHTFEDAALGR